MIFLQLLASFMLIPLLSSTPIIDQDPGTAIDVNGIERNIIDDEEVLSMLRPDPVTELSHDQTGVCVFVKSKEGLYSYKSPGGTQAVCGLYVIANPDQFVEFEFESFDVSCAKGGLLSVIDGWELNGQFFPGTMDHLTPRKERFHEYCGLAKPWKRFKMSQNVGLIEFRIPTKGEGFSVKVTFTSNLKPCNALLQDPQGVYTVRNYGRKINCSVSIMFPERFQILAMSVAAEGSLGSMTLLRNLYGETGVIRRCKKRGSQDFVEIKGGGGLDPDLMVVIDDVCGVDSIPSRQKHEVDCENTAIRLVSSGKFDNSVTIAFSLLDSPKQQCLYTSGSA